MNHARRDFEGLRRYTRLGQVVSALVSVFGMGSLALFFDPTRLGIAQNQMHHYLNQMLWLGLGVVFIGFGLGCFVLFGARSLHLIWVYRHVKSETVQVVVHTESDSEQTTHRAVVQSLGGRSWTLRLYPPNWDIALLDGTSATRAYHDPRSNQPVVIETQHGFLFSMGGHFSMTKPQGSDHAP